MSESIRIARGRPLPLGATTTGDGVNFALLCKHGTRVWIEFLNLDDDSRIGEVELDRHINRTGDHWHIQVNGLPTEFRYGWRVAGPRGPRHRFDPTIVLLDPAATMLSGVAVWGAPCEPHTDRTSRRAVFHRRPRFDWGEDYPPLVPWEDSIIYELHVRSFSIRAPHTQHPGTFAGLRSMIPYLRELGVTAVELLPIHEFDECDCPFTNPFTGERLRNLWGYNTIAFAAPKAAYAAAAMEHQQVSEFRGMVKALHAAGIEIILDVVFNHTGEGDDRGRTYSFRGLDNELYYMLNPDGKYLNFTGCGNTMNCNHPVVRDLLITCLRYWVGDMHIDGFRFDLASILGRDRNGHVLDEPSVIETIAEDGVLARAKLIAEPWDAAGLYQVGRFPFGKRWSEWNGQFRDDVRRFWRGDLGMSRTLAFRICGSPDLYAVADRLPCHSVNFVTCHDGFTLHDLVSYNTKHNEMNGEGNRDGAANEFSWNCGVEGETEDALVLGLRRRQAKNLMATLMLSQGVPMILAGDEFLRTQQGNNNAWCQDNEISWIDWSLKETNADFFRFVKEMIALRKRHPALRRRNWFRDLWMTAPFPEEHRDYRVDEVTPFEMRFTKPPEIIWHGLDPFRPDFSWVARTLAFAIDGRQTGREMDSDFYVALNAWMDPLPFRVPPSPSGRPWRRVVDTALASPLDIVDEMSAPPVPFDMRYLVAPYATVVLISQS